MKWYQEPDYDVVLISLTDRSKGPIWCRSNWCGKVSETFSAILRSIVGSEVVYIRSNQERVGKSGWIRFGQMRLGSASENRWAVDCSSTDVSFFRTEFWSTVGSLREGGAFRMHSSLQSVPMSGDASCYGFVKFSASLSRTMTPIDIDGVREFAELVGGGKVWKWRRAWSSRPDIDGHIIDPLDYFSGMLVVDPDAGELRQGLDSQISLVADLSRS